MSISSVHQCPSVFPKLFPETAWTCHWFIPFGSLRLSDRLSWILTNFANVFDCWVHGPRWNTWTQQAVTEFGNCTPCPTKAVTYSRPFHSRQWFLKTSGLTMAICQWQSFKAAECWICQISLMVTLWCQAIWCYLMLSDAIWCYLMLSDAADSFICLSVSISVLCIQPSVYTK